MFLFNISEFKFNIRGVKYENYELKSKKGVLTYLTLSIPCILKVEGEI